MADKVDAYLQSLDRGGLHPDTAIREVELISFENNNDVVVKTPEGITCHAVFNPFVCMFFADDVYEVISKT